MQIVETEDPRRYCVYLITNLINGKQYAGKTYRTARLRWNAHKSEAKQNNNRYLCKAIRRYGPEAFVVVTVREGMTKQQANEEERLLIRTLNLTDAEFGYNLTEGGDGVFPNEATVARMRERSGMRRWDLPDEEIAELYRQGFSAVFIGKKFNCAPTAVRRHLRWAGVPIRGLDEWRNLLTPEQRSENTNKRKDIDNDHLAGLYLSGVLMEDLAKQFKVSVTTIYRRLVKTGIERRPHGKPKGWIRRSEVEP